MITAAQARILAKRKEAVNAVMETYFKEITLVSQNGNTELKVYHDTIIRKHQLAYMTQAEKEQLFRDVSQKLNVLGYNVSTFDNKVMIDWSKERV